MDLGQYRYSCNHGRSACVDVGRDGDGHPVTVNLEKLSGEILDAWWYSPRDGKLYDADGRATEKPFAHFRKLHKRRFTAPSQGKDNDWVSVLDDAGKDFPPPGRGRQQRQRGGLRQSCVIAAPLLAGQEGQP